MKELPQRSFPPESFPKKAARFVLKQAIHTLPASVLIFAACSGGSAEKNNNQELENRESSGYALPFPEGETWFLTNGPHANGSSNGIKNAIDIAPPELGRLNGNCSRDAANPRVSIDNRVVTASASGEVIIKGDDKNRNDPFHSEIRIKDKNGLTQAYIHLDNTRVNLGDKVKQGDPLGNPSCEFPPGGANIGPHVHIGLMKDGRPIPIDGVKIGGWTIHNGADGKDGTMTKPGEQTRTADTGRVGENYRGIRNDLPNKLNKAVVASPKDPIPPISATITSKEVFTPTPTLTPTATAKPIETKIPTQTPVEKQPEQGWKRFYSNNQLYQIDIPSTWQTNGASDENGTSQDNLLENENDPHATVLLIKSEPADHNLEYYIKKTTDEVEKEGYAKWEIGSQSNVEKNFAPLMQLKLANQKPTFIFVPGYQEPYMTAVAMLTIIDSKVWTIAALTVNSGEKVGMVKKVVESFTPLTEGSIKNEIWKEKWQTFKSPVLPYEAQYPLSWKTKSETIANEPNDFFQDTEKYAFLLDVTNTRIDPKMTLDEYVQNVYLKTYRDNWKLAKPDFNNRTKITKKKIAGLDSQTIHIDSPYGTSWIPTMFVESRPDGSRLLWIVHYNYSKLVSETDRESILNRFLDSFKLVPSVSVEKKASLSKKPEELFRALLTNPISPNILPQGMTSKGTSAGEIDATGKALKQVGAVNILIEDSVSILSGKVFYGIFPDSSGAKSASELIGTHLGNGQVLKDFPYPTKIYTIESSIGGVIYSVTTVLVTSVENVTVITSLSGSDARGANTNLIQSRAISLAHAAIEHLGKVGK